MFDLVKTFRSPEFWLLLIGATLAALGGRAWVVVPLIMAGLMLTSWPKYLDLWPRAVEVGAERAWWITVALSVLSALTCAVACFALGNAARWLRG